MIPALLLALVAAPAQVPDRPMDPARVPMAAATKYPLTFTVPPPVVVSAPIPGLLLETPPPRIDPVPFLRLPRLDPIRTDTDDYSAPGGNTWSHVFHRAARFTQPRFSQCREPLESDGLVIYEGMKLTVSPATGVYELTFAATAPPTPVTVRLQLHFARRGNYAGPGSVYDPIRLTLPPITIEPDAATKPGDSHGPTLRVNHRGYSELFLNESARRSESSDLFPLFRYSQPTPTLDSAGWQIIRTGTARFGSGLPNTDELGQ